MSEQLILGNSYTFRKQRALKNKKANRDALIVATLALLTVIMATTLADTISHLNGQYYTLKGLLTYKLIDRVDGCNVFVNGINEEKKICPDDLKEKDNALR